MVLGMLCVKLTAALPLLLITCNILGQKGPIPTKISILPERQLLPKQWQMPFPFALQVCVSTLAEVHEWKTKEVIQWCPLSVVLLSAALDTCG